MNLTKKEYIEMMKDGAILIVKGVSRQGLLRYEYDEDFDEEGYIQFMSVSDGRCDDCWRAIWDYDLTKMLEKPVEIFKEEELSECDEIVSGLVAMQKLFEGKILRCVRPVTYELRCHRLYKFEDGQVQTKLGNTDWIPSSEFINNLLTKEFKVIL